jgi:hypothetical protein
MLFLAGRFTYDGIRPSAAPHRFPLRPDSAERRWRSAVADSDQPWIQEARAGLPRKSKSLATSRKRGECLCRTSGPRGPRILQLSSKRIELSSPPRIPLFKERDKTFDYWWTPSIGLSATRPMMLPNDRYHSAPMRMPAIGHERENRDCLWNSLARTEPILASASGRIICMCWQSI